jgi:hypothetical protein
VSYASIIAAAELHWNGDADENGSGDANDNTANGRNGTWSGTPGYGTPPFGSGKSFIFTGAEEIAYAYGAASGNRCWSLFNWARGFGRQLFRW